jgi:hypothetical protein
MGKNAASALYYWLLARCPAATVQVDLHQLSESLVQVTDVPKSVPQPGEQIITLAVAAAEREFGKTPIFDETKDLNGRSQDILNWLKTNGDVTKLERR